MKDCKANFDLSHRRVKGSAGSGCPIAGGKRVGEAVASTLRTVVVLVVLVLVVVVVL